MKYLLDSNACISYLNKPCSPKKEKLEQLGGDQVVLCSVVKAELLYVAMKSRDPKTTLNKLQTFFEGFSSLSFDDSAAKVFGEVRAELEKSGKPIGPYDLQIASIALINKITLVSHNTREFSRISNLCLEDWEADK